MRGFTRNEYIMLRPDLSESLCPSVKQENGIPRVSIEWDYPLASFGLALAYNESPFHEVNVAPAQLLDLASVASSISS